jgi:glycosyltransferase involved in cell wall biosynthesis
MPKPRFLVVGPTYTIATNRRKLWALAEYFEMTCATSTFSSRHVYGRPMRDFEEHNLEEPIEVHRFRELPENRENTRFIYRGFASLLKSKTFDFILVENEPWGLLKWQTWLFARTFQSRALFGEFSWENVERPGFKGLLLGWAYRLSAWADHFVVCGNEAGKQIFLKNGAAKKPMLVAPQLGVDTSLFRPATEVERLALRKGQGLPPDAIVVGYCGRLSPEKGVMELYQAVAKIRNEHPEVHLAILGNGPCGDELAQLSRSWCHLFRSRPHFEIPDFIRALDIFVLASKPLCEPGRVWQEQFGHVLIESMASRVLTLGSNSGAIPEVLADPRLLFPHSSASAIADALQLFVENPGLREKIVEMQHTRVLGNYSHAAVAKQYAEFLLGLRESLQNAE